MERPEKSNHQDRPHVVKYEVPRSNLNLPAKRGISSFAQIELQYLNNYNANPSKSSIGINTPYA